MWHYTTARLSQQGYSVVTEQNTRTGVLLTSIHGGSIAILTVNCMCRAVARFCYAGRCPRPCQCHVPRKGKWTLRSRSTCGLDLGRRALLPRVAEPCWHLPLTLVPPGQLRCGVVKATDAQRPSWPNREAALAGRCLLACPSLTSCVFLEPPGPKKAEGGQRPESWPAHLGKAAHTVQVN